MDGVISMERFKTIGLGVLLTAFAAGLLLFPSECAESARAALSLCLETVLPSLFPFFVLSTLLVSSETGSALSRAFAPLMRPLFGIGGAGANALILGLLGGYPVGARTAAELYRGGALSRSEAERLLSFCNNAGPGFIFGICGGAVFTDRRSGLYLYLVHLAAALMAGLLLSRRRRGAPRHSAAAWAERQPRRVSFPAAVRDAFFAVWGVCGFVVLFAVLLRLLTLPLPPAVRQAPWYPLFPGFFELTNGVLSLSSGRRGFVLCSLLLSWGGLSVHAQTLSVLEGTDLSARPFLLGKLVQTALSVPLALLAAGRLYPV